MDELAPWRSVLGLIATALALVQILPYVISILRGRTRPSLSSYIIWATVQILEAAAFIATIGLAPAAWPRIAFAATGLTVLLLAMGYGRHTPWTSFEYIALGSAAAGGLIWLIFGTPLATLLVSAGVSTIAYITTIRKLRLHPGTEDLLAWLLTAVASLLNVIVLTTLSPAIILPPAISLIGAAAIVWLIIFPSKAPAQPLG